MLVRRKHHLRKHHLRASLGAMLFIALPLLAACGPERLEKTEADLKSAVAEAVARGDTATLRLFIEVPFAFDRVYIAGPYTPEATIAAAMGGDWQPEFSRGIESADHFNLLVFEVRGQLYPATLLRSVAEIAPELTGRMYGPDSAVFRVSRVAGSAVPSLLPR